MSASLIPPIPVGQTDTTGVFSGDIGKMYLVDGTYGTNTYKLVKAASGGIAAGSQGLQIALSGGAVTNVVSLNTTSGNQLVCGAIPSTLTGAIAGSAYFLALVEGTDSLATTSSAAASLTSGTVLQPGTASDLVLMTTGVASADLMLVAKANCGFMCVASSATTTALAYAVNYKAPFR